MRYKTSDFIKYDSSYVGNGDFSGKEEAFSSSERLEYLHKYSEFLQKKYNAEQSRKAVNDEEIKFAKERLSDKVAMPVIRKRTSFKKAFVSISDAFSKYEYLSLYGGATVKNDAVIFKDKPVPPTPSCKFAFDADIKTISMAVKIGADYLSVAAKNGRKQKPLVTTVGKTIDFRSGIAEVAEIKFYDNGGVYARVAKREFYHHDFVYLGDYLTDGDNEISFEFEENSYSVTLNGKRTENIDYTENLPVNTVFISSGMYGVGEWRVKPQNVLTGDGKQIYPFAFSNVKENENYVGEAELPYCIAGHKNADKRLIAGVKYDYNGQSKALLHIDTLNPCGEVKVNGERVLVKEDFTAVKADITRFLKSGENEITLIVNPRAPEVNYSWHRNKDPYVGWYLSDFFIDEINGGNLSDLRVITRKVNGSEIQAEISFKAERNGKAELFIKKIFPEDGKEISLGEVNVKGGGFKGKFDFSAEPWTTDFPVLYSVRAAFKGDDGIAVDDVVTETGFRTIEQKNGELLLNGERVILKGALLMQFLPPYENIVKSHVCPADEEIITQLLQIKAMNGNAARLHQLGYGTNDKRFTYFADRLGVCLFWTTSLIDSLETVKWGNIWRHKAVYVEQMREVINSPSIVVWEGSNEFHADKFNFDAIFDEFVSAVKDEDDSRLICPSSHVYYGGGIYGNEGFYYQDDGEKDQDFNPAKSSFGWKDDSVIRSAHNYEILLGYGGKWDTFRKQNWKTQPALFGSKKHAYLITEFAVIGRQDDRTPECKEYIKTDSYELGDENAALGVVLSQKDWRLSQAYQALCAGKTVKLLLGKDADGLAWCCLSGGANDASYLKPPIDFYGYAKYAFYVLRDAFAPTLCYFDGTAVKAGKDFVITPKISGAKKDKKYDVIVTVKDENGNIADEKRYSVKNSEFNVTLAKWQPKINKNGYYEIEYSLEEA